MLTLKQIYDDKAKVIAGLNKKHFANAAEAIDEVLRLDTERKAAQQKKDAAAAEMNKLSKSIGALMGQGKRDEAEAANSSAFRNSVLESYHQSQHLRRSSSLHSTAIQRRRYCQ